MLSYAITPNLSTARDSAFAGPHQLTASHRRTTRQCSCTRPTENRCNTQSATQREPRCPSRHRQGARASHGATVRINSYPKIVAYFDFFSFCALFINPPIYAPRIPICVAQYLYTLSFIAEYLRSCANRIFRTNLPFNLSAV